jgi:WD40 repeat protein
MEPGPGFCPYVGLEPYDESHRDYFFGRSAERRLISANALASRLTVLYGASGTGKSSVLRAGAARDLGALSRTSVVVFGRWQSSNVLPDLKLECQRAAAETAGESKPVDSTLRLDEFLVSLSQVYLRSFVIVLDQFEEFLFYQNLDDSFDPELARAVNREDVPAHFLIALRSDSLSKLDRFRTRIPNLMANTLELRPLTQEAARQAIRKPLDVYNTRFASEATPVTIEDQVVDELVGSLRVGQVQIGATSTPRRAAPQAEEFVEAPFLQLVLMRLWSEEMKAQSRVLRIETLRRLGGPARIVKTHLDTVMGEFSSKERTSAARMFFFLVTPSGSKIALGTEDLANYSRRKVEEIEPTLKRLTDRRILCRVSETDRYEILHDVLAPAVLDWRARYQARQRRKRLIQMGLLTLAIAASLAYAGYYMIFQRHEAEARRLTLTALNEQGSDPELAVILARYAVEIKPGEETINVLHRMLQGLQTREVLRSRHGAVRRTVSSRDGHWLAWTGEDGVVTLHDLTLGSESSLIGHEGPVLGVAFSPDSTMVATAGRDGNLLIRTLENLEQTQRIAAHKDAINAVAFGPGGVVVTASADGSAKLWKVGSDLAQKTFALGDPEVSSVAVRPDGRQVITGDSFGAVTTWDAITGARLKSQGFGPGQINDLSYSPDGLRIGVAAAVGAGQVVDVESGDVLQLRGHESAILGIEFSPSGAKIGTVGSDSTARVWDSESGIELTVLRGHTARVNSITFLGTDGRLATSGGDHTVRIWDNPPNTELLTLAGHTAPVYKIAVDSTGSRLATASADHTARIWNARTGQLLKILEGHTQEVASVAFSHNGSEVVTGSRDKLVRVWNAQTGIRRLLLEGHGDAVVDVAFSPDGKGIATASWDGTARLWNAASGALTATLPCDGDHLAALVFSPDSSRLYTAGHDAKIRIWDVAQAKLLQTWTGQQAPIFGLAMSSDGRRIASSGANGVLANGILKIWDTSTGETTATISTGANSSQAVSFDATGDVVASAGRDGTVSEWEWREPLNRELLKFLGHRGPVYSLVYSPDGKWLASAGEDGTARVYALNKTDLLALARRKTAARKLTAEECRKYLLAVPCPAGF